MGVISENAVSLVLEHCEGYQALLLGPGWGQEDTTRSFIQQLLEISGTISISPKRRRSIGFSSLTPEPEQVEGTDIPLSLPPLVVDADGLNLLAEIGEWWQLLPEGTIITPHPGEMSRLAQLTTKDIQGNRWAIVAEKAKEWNVILVLKGAHTLIATPDGQVTALPFKTDGLATAGTGDVLAGLITGLLAQGMQPADAAVTGGYIHGLAGELAQNHQGSGRSVVASDILGMIPEAWRTMESGW
jgi:NAD(P)H-hydrate epimerase